MINAPPKNFEEGYTAPRSLAYLYESFYAWIAIDNIL